MIRRRSSSRALIAPAMRASSRDAPVVQPPAGIDAAAKLPGIEHDLPDQLEHLAFEDMGADLRIAAALDPGPIVHVLSGAPIAAVHGPVIDGEPSRRAHDLLVAAGRGTAAAAHAALDEALQEVVRDGPAIPLLVQAQLLMHRFEQLPRDDGGHADGYPLGAIPVHPPAADQLLAFARHFGGGTLQARPHPLLTFR